MADDIEVKARRDPRRLRAAAFIALGVAALSLALGIAEFRVFAIIAGLACLLVGATALSQAGRIATSFRPFLKQSVRVQVWGAPLPATNGSPFEVDSIRALGAGLLIHLRRDSDGQRTLLKVAQPGPPTFGDGRMEIGAARYVSWGGKRIQPVAGHQALQVLVARSPQATTGRI